MKRDFWSRLTLMPSGCWEWGGLRDRDGYGRIMVDGHETKTHRRAYALVHGPIPSGLVVCHRCDNPACCNPDHLWLGTNKDNWYDALAKGRRRFAPPKGEGSAKAVLRETDVLEIRTLWKTGNYRQRDLAARFGVTIGAIGKVVTNRTWRHLPE